MSDFTTNVAMFTLGLVLAMGLTNMVSHAVADPATLFDNQCIDCHELSNFEGLDKDEVQEYLLGTFDGTYNHPKTDLTLDDAALMAEYLTNQ